MGFGRFCRGYGCSVSCLSYFERGAFSSCFCSFFLEQSVPTEFYVALSQRLDGGVMVIVIYSDFHVLFSTSFHHFPLSHN